MPASKRCAKCKARRPLASYSRDRYKRDGRSPRCRDCRSAEKRKWNAANRERANAWQRRYTAKKRAGGHPARNPDLWDTPLDGLPRRLTGGGYVAVLVAPGRVELEHRLILAQRLGRPLRAQENAHHRNGVRTDNRLENLELWVRSQPPGQRVSDLSHRITGLWRGPR